MVTGFDKKNRRDESGRKLVVKRWFLGEAALYLYLRDKCRIENTPTALCLCGLQHGLTGQRKSPKMFIVEINNLGALYDRGHLH